MVHRCNARALTRGWIFLAACTLTSVSAWALEPGELAKVTASSQLELPLPVKGVYEVHTLQVNALGNFKDADGSEWLRLDASSADTNEAQTLFVDSDGSAVEVGLVVGELSFADLGVSIAQLRDMAQAGQGQLSYEGKTYTLGGAAKSRFRKDARAEPVPVGYFILQSEEDHDLSIMVLNWGDRVEALQNERLDPSQVKLL